MIEVNYPTGEEDLEDVFIPSKSFKVTSMSALFADDGVGAKGQVKREEASGQTYQILGKALTLSLGTESGYETGQLDEQRKNIFWQRFLSLPSQILTLRGFLIASIHFLD